MYLFKEKQYLCYVWIEKFMIIEKNVMTTYITILVSLPK